MYIPVLSQLIEGAFSFFKNKQEQKKIEIQGNIERIERSDNKEAEWEKIMAEGSKNSWKDEFWTVILAIPLVMCFIPATVPYIREGFLVLETMPEYYRYWLGLAIGAAFAVRQFKK
jgi:hypothetical protein